MQIPPEIGTERREENYVVICKSAHRFNSEVG